MPKGQPIPNPEKSPSLAGSLVSPNQGGATNWYPPTFDPQTSLFYVNATRAFSVYYLYDGTDNPQGWGGNDRGGWSESMLESSSDYTDRQNRLEPQMGGRGQLGASFYGG